MKKLVGAVFAVLFLLPVCANATPIDVNIYSNATISSGEYGTVNIYDTPPDQTTVTMTNGQIEYCNIFDTSVLNFSGGNVLVFSLYDTSNIFANATTSPGFDLYNDSIAYLHSLGNFINVRIYDNAKIHIYGTSLQLLIPEGTSGAVKGYWENGQSFTIALRNTGDFNPLTQVVLHEIPEPSTIFIFGLLSLFIRKRGN
ncbi:MAG: hypothetical protein WC496_12695 [Phycisphaerae bacterium]